MKRKEWKIVPLLLAGALIVTAFGCGKEAEKNTTTTAGSDDMLQYTFTGIPGDRDYIPERDDLREETDAPDVDEPQATVPGNEAPASPTKPGIPAKPTAPVKPGASTTDSSSITETEPTTKKELTRQDLMRILTNLMNNGFNGSAEDAMAYIESEIGRPMTQLEKQAFYVVYNLVGSKGTTVPSEDNGLPPIGQ